MLPIGSKHDGRQRSHETSFDDFVESECSDASDAEPAVSVDQALMGEIHRTGAHTSMHCQNTQLQVGGIPACTGDSHTWLAVCRRGLVVQDPLRDGAPDSAGGRGEPSSTWTEIAEHGYLFVRSRPLQSGRRVPGVECCCVSSPT
jgi:hypothetical protein